MGLLTVACSDDKETATPDGVDASSVGKDGGGSSSGDDDDDDTNGKPDGGGGGGEDAGDSCIGKYAAPDLSGSGACGTIDFGEPAANFGPVDTKDPNYKGTVLPDGIYDAVNAERESTGPGSFRMTMVVKGNRFTWIRQINATGNNAGPIAYRSGTFEIDPSGEQMIKFTYDCAKTGDADAGTVKQDNLPFDGVVSDDCGVRFRFGLSLFRITLRRRAAN